MYESFWCPFLVDHRVVAVVVVCSPILFDVVVVAVIREGEGEREKALSLSPALSLFPQQQQLT